MSAKAIAEQLNSEGVLAPSEYKRLCGLNYHSGFKAGTHAKWQAIQVLRILKNEVYTGTMVQGKRQKINYKILTLLTLPLLVVVWLLKWFVTFLHCCSAWIFYLLGSVLLATAVLSFLMKQSQGIEALQMLIGGFVIFMIPQVVGSVAVFLELAAATIRQVWYI